MTTNQLFAILTFPRDWYDGYCSYNRARVIKHQHKMGKCPKETYTNMFAYFGYIQTDKWDKIETIK